MVIVMQGNYANTAIMKYTTLKLTSGAPVTEDAGMQAAPHYAISTFLHNFFQVCPVRK